MAILEKGGKRVNIKVYFTGIACKWQSLNHLITSINTGPTELICVNHAFLNLSFMSIHARLHLL